MWKLRTMWRVGEPARARPGWVEYIVADTSEEGKPRFDLRVTSRFAAFCRRHSIDELPQLWHVFRGEMSLVGPRPLTRSELDRYYGNDVSRLLSSRSPTGYPVSISIDSPDGDTINVAPPPEGAISIHLVHRALAEM